MVFRQYSSKITWRLQFGLAALLDEGILTGHRERNTEDVDIWDATQQSSQWY